jgi:hypothetical protein
MVMLTSISKRPCGDFADIGGSQFADRSQGGRVFPIVIEKAGFGIAGLMFGGGDADAFVDLGVGQRGMGAEGDEEVDVIPTGGQAGIEFPEEQIDRTGAGMVGDDEQDFFPSSFQSARARSHRRGDFGIGQQSVGESQSAGRLSGHKRVSPR